MKKYFNWLLVSNRPKHLFMGAVLFVLWDFLGAAMSLTHIQIAVTGLAMVFIAMCTAEFKDKTHGSAWDCLDILAGVLVPLAVFLYVMVR